MPVPGLRRSDFPALDRLTYLNTAAVCISHIQYLTGHRLDLAGLAELAHDHGAI